MATIFARSSLLRVAANSRSACVADQRAQCRSSHAANADRCLRPPSPRTAENFLAPPSLWSLFQIVNKQTHTATLAFVQGYRSRAPTDEERKKFCATSGTNQRKMCFFFFKDTRCFVKARRKKCGRDTPFDQYLDLLELPSMNYSSNTVTGQQHHAEDNGMF